MSYGQLVRRHFKALRQPPGEPIFDVRLDDNERIVGIYHQWTVEPASRKTVDHHLIAWVLCDFSPEPA